MYSLLIRTVANAAIDLARNNRRLKLELSIRPKKTAKQPKKGNE